MYCSRAIATSEVVMAFCSLKNATSSDVPWASFMATAFICYIDPRWDDGWMIHALEKVCSVISNIIMQKVLRKRRMRILVHGPSIDHC